MLDIAAMMTEEYQELLEKCVHCGLCLEACPTYAVFGTEMDAPRGRIALMRAAVNGDITHEEFLHTFGEHITLCLECRACESACPSGVQYGKLIEGARIALEEVREPGVIERFVSWIGMHQLMPHVGQMKLLARLMWLYEVLGVQWLVRTLNVLPDPLRSMEAILPPIPATYVDYRHPAPAIGEQRGTIAFFYGCIQEAFLGSINAATVRVLQRNGYEVHFPQQQTCCGAAQWHTGDEALARDLAKKNIEAFEPYGIVVNNAGGCGLTLKEYPGLLGYDADWAERAEVFAGKVQDFSEFLYPNLREAPPGALGIRATYSDSCHLRHGQGVIDEPRALLEMIPGVELIELAHPERCCGSAGIYNIVQSETASAVLDAKMEDLAATGAEVIVTSNTGCHMQLVAGVRRANLNAKVLHVAELLDLSYRVSERNDDLESRQRALTTVKRLHEPVRHPKPLFGTPRLPEHWLAWQERRLRRQGDATLASLREALEPGQVIDHPVELLTYHVDGGLDRGEPVGVVFPYTTEDVQTVVRWARDHDVPVIARGAGTGLAGGAVALRHGLLLEMSHMKQLVDMDVVGRSAVVEAGMVNLTLDEIARGRGFYFPPDPASGRAATIGGNIGANAGGPHCFKYGVTTNYVTGLEAVLADGARVELGGRALDYPELDLVGLMTGSEGTLGVVTEATVRLVRNPPAVKTMLAAFDSVAQAGEAVSAVIAAGLVPATMEMMGHRIMQIVEEYNHPGLPLEAGAALIIDVDGYPESVDPQMAELAAILEANGAMELRVAESEDEAAQIWYARKSAAGAMARLAIDHYTVDGSVPRSKLAETLREVIKVGDDLDLDVLFLLHAGDGNLHPMILVPDPEDEVFLARLHEGGRRMSEVFVAKGGTISGEHGIGIEKQAFMPLMYSQDELDVMQELKALFDPDERLNPDKLFPSEGRNGREEERSAPGPDVDIEGEIAPASVAEVVEAVRAVRASGVTVRIVGGGTKTMAGEVVDVTLATRRLTGIEMYARDDLFVKVRAGTRLADLQAELGADGMGVPLVSPWPEATVGGIVATRMNAPMRMRYGGVRDLVQALTVVMPDGRVVRAGRPVMKNVAGYDLVKLFTGSWGTLGLITDVTFKLSPTPRAVRTLAVPVDTIEVGLDWGRRLLPQVLVASTVMLMRGGPAFDGLDAPLSLIYTAEGLPEDVDAELLQVKSLLRMHGAPPLVELETAGSALWARWAGAPLSGPDARLIRAGMPVKALGPVFDALRGGKVGIDWDAQAMALDLANGHLYLRDGVDLTAIRQVVHAHDGYAVVLRASESRETLDRWGYLSDGQLLMDAIKARWDPQRQFNPGAFVV